MQRVDYLAGTSCGGLLALLLTTNSKHLYISLFYQTIHDAKIIHSFPDRKVEECRRFVFQYKDKVFCGNDVCLS